MTRLSYKLLAVLASLLFVLLAITPAHAQAAGYTATITLKPVTTFSDGTALTGTLSYNVYGAAKGVTKVKTTSTPVNATTLTVANVAPGTCFDVTAVTTTSPFESVHSNESCLPVAPAGTTITVTIVLSATLTQ